MEKNHQYLQWLQLYIFEYEIIPAGIKAHNNHMQARRSTSFNITLLADRILLPFLSGDTPDKPEYDYRLIEVSFPLHPNVHLTYIPCFPVRRRCPIIPGQSLLPLGISCRQQLYRWHSFIPTCTRRDRSKPYSADAGRFSDHPKSEKPASPTKAGELPIAFQSGTLQTSQFLFQLHKHMTFNDLQRICRNTRAG